MSLDLAAVGFETEPFVFDYDWKTVVLYALGVGATKDELDYLYEKRGPLVVPSFAVVPTYPALEPLVEKARADMSKVVHGSQLIRLHAPIPSSGRLLTVARLDGCYDLKRMSQVVFSTKTTTTDGQLLFETEWSLIVRDTGGFGGPRPPKSRSYKPQTGASPAFRIEEKTSPEQALLYRLSGDLNPLHADPDFARDVGFPEGPILHGLCTFGFMTRALLRGALTNGGRLRELSVSFKKPVWPGDVLTTTGTEAEVAQGDGVAGRVLVLETRASERPDAVAAGFATIDVTS